MISRLRQAGLLWPIAFAVPAFCVLVGLGNWQWQRMQWKEWLLERLRQAEKLPPVPINKLLAKAHKDGALDFDAIRFRRVVFNTQMTGAGDALFVWAPQRSGSAWLVIKALPILSDSGANEAMSKPDFEHALVVLGVVADADRAKLKSLQETTAQTVSHVGRIRLNVPNRSAPAPNLKANEWFTRDAVGMTEHLSRQTGRTFAMAPFFLELAAQKSPQGGIIKPVVQGINLSNRHFEYALTWWGLAATLVGVLIAFVYSRFKPAER